MDLSIVILTGNEELHIARCLQRLMPLFGVSDTLPLNRVFVIDCFSKDKTVEIAKSLGATVLEHAWPGNQAMQFNWALGELSIQTKWVLRLDADEYLTPELIDEIKAKLPTLDDDVTGVVFPLRRVWMGRTIRRGTGRVDLLRLFQPSKAMCEIRLMDEHMVLKEGQSVLFEHEFADDNLNDLAWWTQKHIGYALREALDLLNVEYGILEPLQESSQKPNDESRTTGASVASCADQELDLVQGTQGVQNLEPRTSNLAPSLSEQAAAKRAKKLKYAKMPLFFRSFMYFILRYVVKGGFLEGKEGFLWHFLQGWWYRTLVDARIYEIKRGACLQGDASDKAKLQAYLLDRYSIDCHKVNPFDK